MNAQNHEERIAGSAALGTAILAFPAIVVAVLYPVPVGAAPADLVAYLAQHRIVILASLYLSALGWGGALIVFAGALSAVLRRAEGDSGVWALVTFGACVATAVTIIAALAVWGVVVYRVPGIDPGVAAVLYDAGAIANLMTAFPNAIYTIAVAVVIRRTLVLPRWIAYGALLVAFIHLLSATSLARSGAFAPWGMLPSLAPLSHTVWLLAIAGVLLRRRHQGSNLGT